MSYGTGWECDECGKKEITPVFSMYNNYLENLPMKAIPEGWFVIFGPHNPSEGNGAVFNNHHFCSYQCVERYSYHQGKQA